MVAAWCPVRVTIPTGAANPSLLGGDDRYVNCASCICCGLIVPRGSLAADSGKHHKVDDLTYGYRHVFLQLAARVVPPCMGRPLALCVHLTSAAARFSSLVPSDFM